MIELPRRSRPDIHADINIVPYIDVMLVLLVIFMMTTPIIQQGMEVNLPQGPAEPMDLTGSADQPIVISVDKNNNFYLSSVNDAGLKDVDESEAVDLKILINQVFAYYKEYPNSKIVMQADREANWGEIYKVMMYLENNGVPNVIFSSEDPNK
jgi:biopolymer transport protein TolR